MVRRNLAAEHEHAGNPEAHADVALTQADLTHRYVVGELNRQVIDPLLVLNFGPDAEGAVRVEPTPVVDDKKTFFRTVYTTFLANPGFQAQALSTLDMDAIEDLLGLPKANEVDSAGKRDVPPVPGVDQNDPASQALQQMYARMQQGGQASLANENHDDHSRFAPGGDPSGNAHREDKLKQPEREKGGHPSGRPFVESLRRIATPGNTSTKSLYNNHRDANGRFASADTGGGGGSGSGEAGGPHRTAEEKQAHELGRKAAHKSTQVTKSDRKAALEKAGLSDEKHRDAFLAGQKQGDTEREEVQRQAAEAKRLEPLTKRGVKPVDVHELKSDFTPKEGETRQAFHSRYADNLGKKLTALGLPVMKTEATTTNSVYLKGKEFEIRISDHSIRGGMNQDKNQAGNGQYFIRPSEGRKGDEAKARELTNLLLAIVKNHGT